MITERPGLRANIRKLHLLGIFTGSIFLIPIIVPFFQAHGLNLQQIFILQGTFACVMMVLEIPSGYLSDRWGRKNTLVAASFFFFLSILAFCLARTFWELFLAEVLIASAESFFSGTREAMMYDTLLELQETETYRRQDGHNRFLYFTAEAVTGIVGGLLVVLTPATFRAPAVATLIPAALSVLTALSFIEPERHKLQETRHIDVLLRTAKDALRRAPVRGIIILHGILATMTLTLFWLTQPYQMMVGLPFAFFGVVHATIVVAGALAAKYVHTLERWMDDRFLLIVIACVVVGSYLSLGFIGAFWGILFFLFGRTAWGLLSPLTCDILNRMTTSDVRATVLSIKAFVFRLLFALASPAVGYAADILTLQQAFLLAGMIGGLACFLAFLFLRPVWKQIPK